MYASELNRIIKEALNDMSDFDISELESWKDNFKSDIEYIASESENRMSILNVSIDDYIKEPFATAEIKGKKYKIFPKDYDTLYIENFPIMNTYNTKGFVGSVDEIIDMLYNNIKKVF